MRLAIVFIGAGLFGGVIGTVAAYEATGPMYFASGTPDWAAVWTMRWNAGLFLVALFSLGAAIAAGIIAKNNIDAFLRMERVKRTEEQIRVFERDFESIFSTHIGPDVLGIIPYRVRIPTQMQFWQDEATRNDLLRIINYFSWVDDLARNNLFEEELYFNRLGPHLIMTYVVLKPILTLMQEDRTLDLDGFRQLVLRAYWFVKTWDFEPSALDLIRVNNDGNDLILLYADAAASAHGSEGSS